MKKTKLLFTAIAMLGLATTNLQSQNYHISFAGSGASTTVDSVLIQNLTQNTFLTLMGGDTLHLTATYAINENEAADAKLLIFPNPMDGQATLSFYAKHDGNISVSIFDISGKSVLQSNGVVLHGEQQYRISGLKQGIYFISISGVDYTYSSRMINIGTSSYNPKIESVSGEKTVTLTLRQSRAQMGMQYTTGDSLKYTGHSGAVTSMVLDVPTASKTITFVFPAVPTLITDTATNVFDSTAISGGTISSDGGSVITARGVCWSTNHNPTIANSSTSDSIGLGHFTSHISGLIPATTYYVRAYAANSVGIAFGNELSFTTAEFHLGQFYAGGYIFYIDVTGQHGLVALDYDMQVSLKWGCTGTLLPGANGTAMGTGMQNTIDIVNACADPSFAAQYISDDNAHGYTDWYMPSKDELFLAESVLRPMGLGGLNYGDNVWSSSQVDATHAWIYINSSNSMESALWQSEKTYTWYSKPIRNF